MSKKASKSKTIALLGTRGYPSFYGGFETAVRKLAPALADAGWAVSVYGRPGQTRVDDPNLDRRVQRITTRGLESKKTSTLTFGFTSAVDAARRKPDVVIVMNCANGLWLPLLKLRGIATAVNVDGMEWERAKWGRVAKAVFKLGAHFTARFADVIICDAQAISDRWQEQFGRSSQVIAYGGEPASESPSPLGLATGTYVLWVARLVPENTIEEFMQAVSVVADTYPVVIVGSSGYADDLDLKVRELAQHPNVYALGHVSDDELLHSLWAHCGAYFHGHSVGGTNPALVQAMASGAPVVARDTVFNREVLDDAAIFVEPTSDAIAAGIQKMMSDRDLASEVSQRAKVRAVTHYSWKVICEQYEKVARSLVSR
ncbi:glycosyltransferase involved in cell wall biosynthesis [Microbacterium sp. 1154]|uniref:glycosyltransferase n=1 Tax=Microbacterium sp. 1154 TaxID=2817733 RepID=UPI002860B5F0|nr:glycosyltransferase [Microbacterium sp. 1154]MDR6691214.1 glycosyltransferase involved in cell wall biosynthesis [Microbacterium sp. 1154]